MANLKERAQWEEGVYQLETSDPVMGGPDGIDNVQAKQLANRTRYLKGAIEQQDSDKVSKAGDAMTGALLGKVGSGAGSNAGFGFDGDPDTGLFSPKAGVLQVTLKGVPAAEWSLDATGQRKMRTSVAASFDNGVRAGLDHGDGGQFRAVCDGYGAFIRNDGWSVYLLSTPKGVPDGGFNDYRPFSWSLSTGQVIIDGNGSGTVFGGTVNIAHDLEVGRNANEGHIKLGPADGYLYANQLSTGWWSSTGSSYQYMFADHTFRIDGRIAWHEGNLTPLDLNTGGTLKGDLTCEPGTRIVLAEGSVTAPSLAFGNDGAPDTGLYHLADGVFGVTCNTNSVLRFTPTLAVFDQPVTGPTPSSGDRSTRLATTQWVADAISTASVGQIVFEMRTSARAGYLKCNGAVLKRADYPALWTYAQASGALVAEKDWSTGNWGCYSDGDGAATFRIPELRGEFMRCWDDGRGFDVDRRIGTSQDSQNRSHAHAASTDEAPDHVHTAWTDAQGNHSHGGATQWSGDHAHTAPGAPGSGQGYPGVNSVQQSAGESRTSVAGGHSHTIATDGGHGHNVGIGGGGRHRHTVSVTADGGSESRPRNIAVMAMLRAY